MTGQAIAMSATADRPTDDTTARLGTLFDAHHQRLYRLARRLSRSAEDASDLVQETFLRAARHTASVPEGAGHEEAWLVRVLINLARDRWRQLAVRKRGADDAALSTTPVVADSETALLARSIIWQALDRLPPRRRRTNHRFRGAQNARMEPVLPEREVCDDFRNRMLNAGQTPLGIGRGQALDRLLGGEVGNR